MLEGQQLDLGNRRAGARKGHIAGCQRGMEVRFSSVYQIPYIIENEHWMVVAGLVSCIDLIQ